jgi:hypothetical protein
MQGFQSEPMATITAQHLSIVREMLIQLPQNAGIAGRKGWTPAVKRTMHDLCIKYVGSCGREFWGTHPCESGQQHYEWLLDAAWYIQSSQNEEILLGLESEWDDSLTEVQSDFAKLLTVKAPVKILLFEAGAHSGHTESEQISSLQALCRKWNQHSRGDFI